MRASRVITSVPPVGEDVRHKQCIFSDPGLGLLAAWRGGSNLTVELHFLAPATKTICGADTAKSCSALLLEHSL